MHELINQYKLDELINRSSQPSKSKITKAELIEILREYNIKGCSSTSDIEELANVLLETIQ